MKITICDPPSGWLYGFPRPFDFEPSHPHLPGEEFQKEWYQWWTDQGYPAKLILAGNLNYVRYWEMDIDEDTLSNT